MTTITGSHGVNNINSAGWLKTPVDLMCPVENEAVGSEMYLVATATCNDAEIRANRLKT